MVCDRQNVASAKVLIVGSQKTPPPKSSGAADFVLYTDFVTATFSLLALWVLFSPGTQSKDRPITIEVRQDVEVTHNTESYESRGKLYLTDLNTRNFGLRKARGSR